MDAVSQVQFLDKTVCISYDTDVFGKVLNPTILPPSMGK